MNYVRKSVVDTQVLVSCVGFRLPTKNSTRWNSTFYMLATFLKAIDAEPALQNRLNATKKHKALTAIEIVVLREIVAILKPFESVSNDFQADFETIGNVIPAYLGLLNLLTLTVKDRAGVEIPNPTSSLAPVVKKCKEFVGALRESLQRRFSFVLFDANYVLGNQQIINSGLKSRFFILIRSSFILRYYPRPAFQDRMDQAIRIYGRSRNGCCEDRD